MKILLSALCLSLVSITTSTYIQNKLINNISLALEDIYTYFLDSNKENLNGFRGVMLSKAILEGTNPDVVELGRLKRMATKVIQKLQNNFLKNLHKEPSMIQYLPDLEKWQKETKFGLNTLDRNYTNLYVALDAHEFLKDITYTSVTNIFLEKCLMQILSDSDPKTNQCDISPSCRSILINSSSIYTGYSATKRVRYLQTLRLVGCAKNDKEIQQHIQKYCSYIMWEAQNLRQFHLIGMLFDLLFEQITLCGMEGYSDFMQTIFLYHTFKTRGLKESCYKQPTPTKQLERKTIYKYTCSDRTTGMAASVFALYLKCYAQRLSQV